MDDRAALLAAVCERPDDDTPRLVYADWCDDHGDAAYARFIRTQVELARVPEWDIAWVRAWHRERGLVTGLPFQSRYSVPRMAGIDTFRRGFPWAVECQTPAEFAAEADVIFARAPVQSFSVRARYHEPPPDPHALGTDSRFTQLRRLAFSLTRYEGDAIRQLAESPHLMGVTEMAFEFDGIRDDGLVALFGSDLLGRLTRLQLHSTNQVRAALLAGYGKRSSLRSLTLSASGIGGGDLPDVFSGPLFRGLVELDLSQNHLRPAGVAALAASPAAATLESLTLSRTAPGVPGVRALAASPALVNLRRLDLRGCDLGPVAAKAIAQSPHLRNLAVLDLGGNPIGDKGALALADSPHLRNLIVLDLMHARLTDRGAAALLGSPVTANLIHFGLIGDQSLSPEMRARVWARFGT